MLTARRRGGPHRHASRPNHEKQKKNKPKVFIQHPPPPETYLLGPDAPPGPERLPPAPRSPHHPGSFSVHRRFAGRGCQRGGRPAPAPPTRWGPRKARTPDALPARRPPAALLARTRVPATPDIHQPRGGAERRRRPPSSGRAQGLRGGGRRRAAGAASGSERHGPGRGRRPRPEAAAGAAARGDARGPWRSRIGRLEEHTPGLPARGHNVYRLNVCLLHGANAGRHAGGGRPEPGAAGPCRSFAGSARPPAVFAPPFPLTPPSAPCPLPPHRCRRNRPPTQR